MKLEQKVRLWDEINRYVVTCGGDPSKHVYGNTPRMDAVCAVEKAVDDFLLDAYQGDFDPMTDAPLCGALPAPIDPELQARRAFEAGLDSLSVEARLRVIEWVRSRFGAP